MTEIEPIRWRRSLKSKLLIYLFSLSVVSTCGVGLLSRGLVEQYIKSNTAELTLLHQKQINQGIDQSISELNNISMSILAETTVDPLLTEPGLTENDHLGEVRAFERFLFDLSSFRKEITGVYVISLKNRHVFFSTASKSPVANYNVLDEPWLSKALQNKAGFTITVDRNPNQILFVSEPLVIFLRSILDKKTGEPIGIIRIDQKISSIEKMVSDVSLIKGSGLMVLDPGGEELYNNGTLKLSHLPNSTGPEYPIIDGKPYLMTSVSSFTGLKSIAWVPVKALTQKSETISWLILSFIGGIAAVVFLLSLVISRRVTLPLERLRKKMSHFGSWDLSSRMAGERPLRVPVETKDEIGQLSRTFNDMVEMIQNHMKQIAQLEGNAVEAEIERKELEFQALYLQINPHFIYNSIESIVLVAELNGDRQAARMAVVLAKMMRYSFERGSGIVPLSEELEQIGHYVALQNLRYDGRFELVVDVPESFQSCLVMKFTLQPIVENALIHGLPSVKGRAWIHIAAHRDEAGLHLMIKDNGKGIGADKLRYLQGGWDDPHAEPHIGTGLRNVRRRLELLYGPPGSMSFHCEDGSGTTVEIVLPPGGQST